MKANLVLILVFIIISGCNNKETTLCCAAVTPKSTFTLQATPKTPLEIKFLIQISYALERYKTKNFEYPAFETKYYTNDQVFGLTVNHEKQLFLALKDYCDETCKELIDDSGFQIKTGYISNGAQYKLLFFDRNLCESIKVEMPAIVNPRADKQCLAIGLWTPRATYW